MEIWNTLANALGVCLSTQAGFKVDLSPNFIRSIAPRAHLQRGRLGSSCFVRAVRTDKASFRKEARQMNTEDAVLVATVREEIRKRGHFVDTIEI